MYREKRVRNGKTRYTLRQDDEHKEICAILLEVQDGQCAICERDIALNMGPSGAHLDHDHDTGTIRGLLCANCNKGLGMFYDSPILLQKAASYIEIYGIDSISSLDEDE